MKTLAVLCLVLTASSAGGSNTPYALYASGAYADAIKAGIEQNDGAGFALAARAALADANTREVPCLECLKRAEDYARRAIAADAKAPDGHTYLAVSLGYEARIVGMLTARLHNYPGHAKDELDAALADDPSNVWAHAALAGWNIEIVRVGGETMAKWLYDATVPIGLDEFSTAFKIAPDNIALRFQCALSLSGYDLDRFRDQIRDALERAADGTPATAYERVVRARAIELLGLLKRGERAAFSARVRKYQGYP